MSVGVVQRSVLYIKEIQDVGLFAVMADSRLFLAFAASPLYYIMLPMIGLLITVLALINGYHLANASNRNFDKWSQFIVSGICAVCASVALYGGALTTFLGLTFAAGPWFFLSSVLVAFTHQALMLGLNIYRAYESLEDSSQRMHYIQASLNNLFNLGLIVSIIGAVIFVMLLPIAPYVAAAFAISAAILTAANIAWRLAPYNWKQAIKGYLNLGKQEIIQQEQAHQLSEAIEKSVPAFNQNDTHPRLFTRCDYSVQIKTFTADIGEIYLQRIINNKIATLNDQTEKSIQKAGLLSKLSSTLSSRTVITKNQLSDEYPLAFQSFWTEKGDVEQIVDAAMILQDKMLMSSKQVARLSNEIDMRADVALWRDPHCLTEDERPIIERNLYR